MTNEQHVQSKPTKTKVSNEKMVTYRRPVRDFDEIELVLINV